MFHTMHFLGIWRPKTVERKGMTLSGNTIQGVKYKVTFEIEAPNGAGELFVKAVEFDLRRLCGASPSSTSAPRSLSAAERITGEIARVVAGSRR